MLPYAVGVFTLLILSITALVVWYGNKVLPDDDETAR